MRAIIPFLIWTFVSCPPRDADGQTRLTAEEAVRLGLEESETIRAARADAEAAEAAYRQAAAARWPSINTHASYTRLSDNIPEIAFDTDFLPGIDTSFTLAPVVLNRYYSEIAVEQPLFTGFRLRNRIEAARHQADAAMHDAAEQQADVAFRVRRAYWRLYQADAFLAATQRALEQVETHLKDVVNRFEAGAALQSEVLSVRTRRSEVRLQRVEAENAVQLAELELSRLIGLPLDADLALEATVDVSEPVEELDALVAQALDARDLLGALRAQVDAFEAEVAAAQGSWFPDVALNGRYVYSRPNQYFFAEQDEFKATWEAGVALQWSIWDGGSRRAEIRRAQAHLESAEAQLAAAREEVEVEVTRQYLEFQRARQAVAVTEQNVEEAEESLRMTRRQYAAGAALSAAVLDAEQALRTANARRAEALADYAIARAGLRNAVGQIW